MTVGHAHMCRCAVVFDPEAISAKNSVTIHQIPRLLICRVSHKQDILASLGNLELEVLN